MNLSEKIVNTSQIFEGDIIKINKPFLLEVTSSNSYA